MINGRIIAISAFMAFLIAPMSQAQDLSRYREFQFGMSLPAVAKQTRKKPTEAIVLHQRPGVIQELVWESLSSTHSSPQSESVKDIRFSFYNGQLSRMLVKYDWERTEGMTAEDMIDAISAKYGTPTKPVAEITIFSTHTYSDNDKTYSTYKEKVIARWEDEQYSFDLFQSSTLSTFGLVAYSKRLDAQAQTSIVEAIRLDQQEAPQREIERQKNKADVIRAQQEKARKANKLPFRP
jgi:hypothetical protein